MSGVADEKAAARARAAEVRRAAHAAGQGNADMRLLEALRPHLGRPLAGYWPIRDEIDPRPAMEAAAAHGVVALPVVEGAGRALAFRAWTPGAELVRAALGTAVPAGTGAVVPGVLIVPLLAFTARGERLGYGGGFYDRTIAALRGRGGVVAIGFAFAAQEVESLPLEPTDERLDLVVTEAGVVRSPDGTR